MILARQSAAPIRIEKKSGFVMTRLLRGNLHKLMNGTVKNGLRLWKMKTATTSFLRLLIIV